MEGSSYLGASTYPSTSASCHINNKSTCTFNLSIHKTSSSALSHLWSQRCKGGGDSALPIFPLRKLRHGEVKKLVQDLTAGNQEQRLRPTLFYCNTQHLSGKGHRALCPCSVLPGTWQWAFHSPRALLIQRMSPRPPWKGSGLLGTDGRLPRSPWRPTAL